MHRRSSHRGSTSARVAANEVAWARGYWARIVAGEGGSAALLPAAALVLLVLAAYFPAIVWGGYVWDDDAHLLHDQRLGTMSGLADIWLKPLSSQQYYPLVHTTFWLEHRSWGFWPAGYHLVNVLLQAACAVLVWRLLASLEVPGAWLAAAVFAIHPVQVESVAWVSERKNVLSGMFYFASALAYLRFRPLCGAAEAEPTRRTGWYIASLLLFTAGLLSKTVVATLPAALLLITWWKRGRLHRSDVAPLLPWFVLGIGFGLMTAWLERAHVGAAGAEWSLTFVERLLVAGRAAWFYLGKLIWPVPIVFHYPRWQIDTAAWWQYLFPLAAVVVLVLLWVGRARLGRGPLVAMLYFGGTLLPALGFLNVYPMRYSFVADHFQYLACLGPIALLCAGGTMAWKRLVFAAQGGTVFVTAGGALATFLAAWVLLLSLSVLTAEECRKYQDAETLWRDTLRKNPGAVAALVHLGNVQLKKNDVGGAFQSFAEAARVRPDDPTIQYNLGWTKYLSKRAAEGRREIEQSLANPRLSEAERVAPLSLLAHLHAQQGEWDAAHKYDEQVNRHYRTYFLSLPSEVQGRLKGHLERYIISHNNAAWRLATHPDADERDGEKAVRLATVACSRTGFRDPLLLDTLAAAYGESGDFDRAAETAADALAIAEEQDAANVAELQAHLELFRSARPLRDPKFTATQNGAKTH